MPSARLTTPGSGRGHGVSLFFCPYFYFPRRPVGKRPFCIKYCILGCQDVLYILYFFSTVTPAAKVFKRKQKGFPQKEEVFLVENSQKPLDLPCFPQSFPHTVENSPFPHPFSTGKPPLHENCAKGTIFSQLVKTCMKFDSYQIAKSKPVKNKKAAVLTHSGSLSFLTSPMRPDGRSAPHTSCPYASSAWDTY